MRRLLLGITGCLALTTIVLVSCKKTDNDQNNAHPEALKKMAATYGYADFPKNDNGLLVFRDSKHFDSYMDFLDMAEAKIDPNDENQDVNTVLQDIEKAQGFNSLRAVSHAQYEQQNAIGWPRPEAIPDEHFITSPEMRSVLNNQLEVQVGTEILHYVNKDIRVNVDAFNKTMLDKYRRLSPIATLDDVRFIDPFLNGSSIEFTDLDGSLINFGKGTVPKPTGTEFVQMPYVKFPNACNNPRLAEFNGLAARNASGYIQGNLLVKYGDGTQEWKYPTLTGSGWKVPAFQHTYPAFGQYTLTVILNGGVDTKSQTVKVTANGCKENYKSTDWQYGYISSTVAWGGKLEMQQIGNNSNKRGRLIAYTKLVRQNSDGSWSGFKGKIFTRLGCDAKSTDGNCTIVDHLVGEGYDNNKKENLVHRTGQGPFNWDMAWAQHTYIDDNGEHTIWSQLNVCP
jgi:hypothetical protein